MSLSKTLCFLFLLGGLFLAHSDQPVWLHEIRPDDNPWASFIRERARDREPGLVVTISLRSFLQQAFPLAQQLQVQYNIPASATLAQAVYESAYGNSRLAKEFHNYFGLKSGHWSGQTARHVLTRDAGKLVYADFRAYPSMAAGFQGYAEFLQTPNYRLAARETSGIGFIRRVLEAGYCPDPGYLENIQKIITTYGLESAAFKPR